MNIISIITLLMLINPTATFAADAAHPTVVELYQSQGCSSCPPANAMVNALAGRPDILALSFAVTYWDRLGWKDTFAKPEYTARQWDFAHAGGRGNVATPQIVVNGKSVVTGADRGRLIAALRQGDRGASGPAIVGGAGKVTIGSGRVATPATVWLVRYDPRTIAVPIRAGENGGRTLPHRNIVRSLVRLGGWNGKVMQFSIKPVPAPFRTAVLVQAGTGRVILAASKI